MGRRRGAKRRRLLFVGPLLAGFVAAGMAGARAQAHAHTETTPNAADIAARIDRHYNALHSLSVHFVQRYAGMGLNRKESGVLLLKKPGKMSWTYTDPDGKLFVLDGKDGYFYSPGESEAQKVPQKQLDDLRSPLRFLLGHTELEKELTGLKATCDGSGTCVLTGTPKGLEQRVSAMKITAQADGTIRQMEIDETDGVTNQFDFSGELANAPAPASAFVFTPPAGVHVVEGEPPV
jgi:outer membrane lipoprotein carrier protein